MVKDKKYEIKKFNNVFFTDKINPISEQNSIWRGKFKIWCLKTQLDFF